MQNNSYRDLIRNARNNVNKKIINSNDYKIWYNNLKNKNTEPIPLPLLRTYNDSEIYDDEDSLNYEYTFATIQNFCIDSKNSHKYKKIITYKSLLENIALSYGLNNKYDRGQYVLSNCYILIKNLNTLM